jgi:predicted amidohydrolase YtcJ
VTVQPPADTVLRASALFDAPQDAASVAISGERITAVGTWDEVREHVGSSTRVLEAPGGLILPGFQDAHIHTAEGGRVLSLCDLHDVSGLQGYLAAVTAYAQAHPDRPWIEGGGWAMSDFPNGYPHRAALDKILPDRPVFLQNSDAHDAWVNTRALAAAGIDQDTPDPPKGRIGRDRDGQPSGVLHEAAMGLVAELLPDPSASEWETAILAGQAHLLRLGVTAWQDVNVFPEWVEAYRRLADDGRLLGRVTVGMHWDADRDLDQVAELVERRRSATGGRLQVETVKLFQDGIVENGSAAMLEPYAGSEQRGESVFEPDELAAIVATLDAEGFQVHVHAIGDRAVREALDAFEAVRRTNGPRDARHTIAHLQVVHPEDVPRFAALDVIPNGQPYWACLEPQMVELNLPVLGPDRSTHQYPFGSLLRSGAQLAFGSDWTVTTADPLQEMTVAVTRQVPGRPESDVFLPDERLTPAEAITAFTTGSARVNRLDRETGAMEPGRLADLAIVDRDIREPGAMETARVLLTVVGGEVVHADPEVG